MRGCVSDSVVGGTQRQPDRRWWCGIGALRRRAWCRAGTTGASSRRCAAIHAPTSTAYGPPELQQVRSLDLRRIPALEIDLASTAIGKDYPGSSIFASAPSGRAPAVARWLARCRGHRGRWPGVKPARSELRHEPGRRQVADLRLHRTADAAGCVRVPQLAGTSAYPAGSQLLPGCERHGSRASVGAWVSILACRDWRPRARWKMTLERHAVRRPLCSGQVTRIYVGNGSRY
jgi:hypothetical protein